MTNKINIPGVNEDLAYFCGVLAGDGSINIRKNKHEYEIKCIGNPKDEVEFYHKIVSPLIKKLFDLDIIPKFHDKGTTYGVRFCSKQMVLFLIENIGLPNGKKYNKLKIPELFLNDRKLLFSYIRGLFDTDGCVCFKKKRNLPVISISSKSSKFLKEIAEVLTNLEFTFYEVYDYKQIDIRAKKGFTLISRLELSGKSNLELWMNTIQFFSPKHMDKINNYIENKVAGEGFEPPTFAQAFIS